MQIMSYIHQGTRCNKCGMAPIEGTRYLCRNCKQTGNKYNLCRICHEDCYKFHPITHGFTAVNKNTVAGSSAGKNKYRK